MTKADPRVLEKRKKKERARGRNSLLDVIRIVVVESTIIHGSKI